MADDLGRHDNIENTEISTHISNIIHRLGTGDIESMEDDFLTFEEKRTLKIYENMNAEEILKQILEEEDEKPRGFIPKWADRAYKIIREYRTDFFLGVTFIILLWIFLNTGLHSFIPVLETGMLSGLTHLDPFPFKFLTLIMSLGSFIIAQLILIAQRKEAKLTRKKAEFQFLLHLEQKINLKVVKHKQDLLQKKMDNLYKIHEDIMPILFALPKSISADVVKSLSSEMKSLKNQ